MNDGAIEPATAGMLCCRAVRGATMVEENSADAITGRTRELLEALVVANGIHPDDVASVFFTTTPDLDAAYPAIAARRIGWTDVGLLGGVEIAPPGSLPRCVRVLVHWNTTRRPREIVHLYIRGAEALRPDRSPDGLPAQPDAVAR